MSLSQYALHALNNFFFAENMGTWREKHRLRACFIILVYLHHIVTFVGRAVLGFNSLDPLIFPRLLIHVHLLMMHGRGHGGHSSAR